jgi:HK97 family phage prohead protease
MSPASLHTQTRKEQTALPVKAASAGGQRFIEGYASVFGNVDTYGDSVQPGAFDHAANRGRDIPLLWQHDDREVIGLVKEWREDDKGLWFKAEVYPEIQRGKEILVLAERGALRGVSFGFKTLEFDYDPERKAEDGRPVCNLTKLHLAEISPVTFPANQLAAINAVKSMKIVRLKSGELARVVSAKAEAGEVAVGDFITWGDDDAPTVGVVDVILTAPSETAPLPEGVVPTEAAPVVLATQMAATDEGLWMRTEDQVALAMSEVTRIDPLPMDDATGENAADTDADTDKDELEAEASAGESLTLTAEQSTKLREALAGIQTFCTEILPILGATAPATPPPEAEASAPSSVPKSALHAVRRATARLASLSR